MKMPIVKNAALLELAFAVRRAVFLMDCAVDKALAKNGRVTFSQLMLLRTVSVRPGVTQRELAAEMNYTEATVSRQVEVFIKKNLLVRVRVPHTRRAMALTLTAAGETEVLESIKEGFAVIEEYYERVNETLRDDMKKTFEVMTEGLKHL